MRIGIRGKLFVVPLFIYLAVLVVSGPFLERKLRGSLMGRIEEELFRHARSTREILATAPRLDITTIDALADRLGDATSARITVIAEDGTVLGDSMLPARAVAEMENHGSRPEVIEARTSGKGIERRYSKTLQTEMLYVALPYERADGRGVVRAAKPLAEIGEAVGSLRRILAVAGLFGLIAAVLVAAFASYLMSGTFRSLVDSARAIAAGEAGQRIEVHTHDEVGALAGSLNRMAEEIERTMAELASERHRFETVLDGMSGAVVALDPEGRITLMNPSARQLLDLESGGEGRSFSELVRAPALVGLLSEAEATDGASAELELPLGEHRVVARVTPQLDGQGSLLVMYDITKLRRLETIRRDFVANVSHELRTPVSVIRANAETLLEGAASDPDYGPKLLSAVLRNAERVSEIINDLLELSRLEAGRRELERRTVSLADVAERASETVADAAAEKGTRIDLDVEEGLAVNADGSALEQVVLNLLENAVKHTPEGSQIEIRAERRGSAVRIQICDDGPGIDEQHQSRIFERFYRVDPGRSRAMGGTGLGLSIVKHLTEAMGGTVGVEPREPRGSVFWIELPRAA